LRRRLLDVDDRIPQDHENEAVERYEEEHFLSNLLLHGSPMAINDRITEKPGAVTVNLGPIRQHLANGLRHAYWSYYRTCLLAVGLWEGNHKPGLEHLYRSGWPRLQTVTDGALEAAGRNGECPCNSGLKIKKCHGSI
jgi:hypothetical protein